MKKTFSILIGMMMAFLPSLAFAHSGHGALGFADGFTHPFTGIDHIIALVVLGVFASQVRLQRAAVAVALFLAVFVAAFAAAGAGFSLPYQEPMLALSLVGLSTFIILGNRIPFAMAAAVVGLFAAYHGVAHGKELLSSGTAGIAMGTIAACCVLIGGSYGFARMLSNRTGLAAIRYRQAAAGFSMTAGLLLLATG